MTQTAPHSRPQAIEACVEGLSRPAGVAALVAGACLSALAAFVGWFLGAASLTAVEPGASWTVAQLCSIALIRFPIRPARAPTSPCLP